MCKQYIVITILLLAVALVYSARSSGLYVDNGFDQTVVLQNFTRKEKRNVEKELLNLLGLQRRPKRMARRTLIVKRSAPKFLLNIYRNVLYNEHNTIKQHHEKIDEFGLNSEDISVIDQSDIIMTFGAHNPHSVDGSNRNRGRRIWFDVSEVPSGERLMGAELRLYHSQDSKESTTRNIHTIAVYRVARTISGARVKHYVNSANTTIDQEGWITLNISVALEHWMNYPKENRGLFLAIHHADYAGHIMRPDDIGIVGVSGIPDKQPFMVAFFKESDMPKTMHRQRRTAKRTESAVSKLDAENHPYVNSAFRRIPKPCNIQTLHVSFKDLEWQDWIIAPEGYDAYYCSGECNFPLNTHFNATNHAIIQTLVHLMKPAKVPKPSCAPTKLSPISVLYFLDDSNVVLKKYKNMIVDSCGCH